MSAETSPSGEAELPTATTHEAELASGPSGAVEWGPELEFEQTVSRRRRGLGVVVRGGIGKANQQFAGRVEAAVGPRTRAQPPERKAGPLALPHFHHESRDPEGHTFYETDKRKARKQK
jgi:hypothetical protein